MFGGDLDGDGADEVVADAMAWPAGGRSGRLYVLDTTVADVADARVVVDGDPGVQHLGAGTAVADLDGDGTADLAVGSPGLASLGTGTFGRVMIFYGPLAGHVDSDQAGRIFAGGEPDDETGWRVRAGDLAGDGITDLLASAPYSDGDTPDAGRVYVVDGTVLPW